MVENKIKRICSCCKQSFNVTESNINEVIYYDTKSYHSKCFIDMCTIKANSNDKRIKSDKWKQTLNSIHDIQSSSYKYFQNLLYKDQVYQFILDNYDITIIPSKTWEKIAAIYNGTYKGMSRGIPANHLLDMWQKKMNYLNKVANQNVIKGKTFNTSQRINYDLSILINKYDSYLKWLEQQKILESKVEVNNVSLLVPKGIEKIENKKPNNNEDNIDISSLVDDIFGD